MAIIHNIGWDGKGGATYGWEHSDTVFRVAVAICSDSDQYCKKVGRELVEMRIGLTKLNLTVPMTAVISWDAFVEKVIECKEVDFFFPAIKKENYMVFMNQLNFNMLNRGTLRKLMMLLLGGNL